MALVWMEGFDFYGNVATLILKYPFGASTVPTNTGTYTLGPGRGTGSSLSLPRNAAAQFTIQPLPIFNSYVVGFGVNFNGTLCSYPGFVQFQQDGFTHLSLNLAATGTITGMAQSPLAVTANSVTANSYYYFEIKFVISNTAGSMQLRVNGSQWFNVPSANTFNSLANNPSKSINQVTFANLSGTTADLYIDDFYAVTTTGFIPTDYLGPISIQAMLPSGFASGGIGWTVTGASQNYQAVNQSPPNTSVFVGSGEGAIGTSDIYAFPALSGSNKIVALDFNYLVQRGLKGPGTIAPLIASNVGAFIVPGTAFGYKSQILTNDPVIASSWTITSINSHHFGIYRGA